MPWSKLDDGLHENAKIAAMSDKAFRLYICGITYSARHHLRGNISVGQVSVLFRLTGAKQKHADELVSIDAWELTEVGFAIHDYEDYQANQEEISLKRAEAGRIGGQRSGEKRSEATKQNRSNCLEANEANAKQTRSKREAKGTTRGGTPIPEPEPTPGPMPLPEPTPNVKSVNAGVQTADPACTDLVTTNGHGEPTSRATWRSYKQAYVETYKVEPVQNAKVASQVNQFVKRVPAADAPPMAAWFLKHRGQWYVREGHSMGSLLKDCEKLHTEWLTGITVHRKDADEIDRLSADKAMYERVAARVEAKRTNNETE